MLVREKHTFPLEMLQSSKLPKLAEDDGDNVGEYNGDNDGEYDGEYEGDNGGSYYGDNDKEYDGCSRQAKN